MADIMLDLETMSTKNNAAIIAIGAVAFSEHDGISAEFYHEISLESCQKHGLHIDANTVLWWIAQSKDAQDKFKDNSQADSLECGLIAFSEFCGKHLTGQIWGNGSTFDNVILRNAYEVTSNEYPAAFWNDACYRTVRGLNPSVEFNRVGTYHYALDDAKTQALHLIKILNNKTRFDSANS